MKSLFNENQKPLLKPLQAKPQWLPSDEVLPLSYFQYPSSFVQVCLQWQSVHQVQEGEGFQNFE